MLLMVNILTESKFIRYNVSVFGKLQLKRGRKKKMIRLTKLKKLTKAAIVASLAITLAIPANSGIRLEATYSSTVYANALEIADVASFLDFAKKVNDGDDFKGKTVVLSKDIRFDGTLNNWTTLTGEFNGAFDGKGHEISGINMMNANNPKMIGLFGKIGKDGSVKNLALSDTKIVAGANKDTAKKSDYEVYGVGGICAENEGIIENCSVDVEMAAESYFYFDYNPYDWWCYAVHAGTVCGKNTGIIRNCSSNGKIEYGFIHDYNNRFSKKMYDNHIAVGGLAGSTSGTIENSYYNGQITYNGEGVEHYKKINIGGIAGKIAGEENDTPAINNCYSNAVITADDEVSSKGIITGYAKTGTIVTCCYGSDNGKLDIIGTSNGTSKDNQLQDTIASVDFVNTLNTNRGTKAQLSKWTLENNQPVFVKRHYTTISTIQNGSLELDTVPSDKSLDNGYFQEGDNISIQAKPNSGYQLATISVKTASGSAVALTYMENEKKYTFTMPQQDVIISAEFQKDSTNTTKEPTQTNKPQQSTTPTQTTKPELSATPTIEPQPSIEPIQTTKPQPTKVPMPEDEPIMEDVKVGKPKIKTAVNQKGKKVKVSWSKASNAEGYAVYYATNSRMSKAGKVHTRSLSKTLTKLKKGKTYYIKVRAFATNYDGEIIYGSYSVAKKVKIKK